MYSQATKDGNRAPGLGWVRRMVGSHHSWGLGLGTDCHRAGSWKIQYLRSVDQGKGASAMTGVCIPGAWFLTSCIMSVLYSVGFRDPAGRCSCVCRSTLYSLFTCKFGPRITYCTYFVHKTPRTSRMVLASAQELVGSICAQIDVDQISRGTTTFRVSTTDVTLWVVVRSHSILSGTGTW